MSLREELGQIDGPRLRESFDQYWERLQESGESPSQAGDRIQQDYHGLGSIASHIEEDMRKMGKSPKEAHKYAYGAALAVLALKEYAEQSEVEAIVEGQ